MANQREDNAVGAREGGQEYLAFSLGDSEYAIDILKVQEIRNHETPTRIAGAPDHVLGVVNLRGTIVPIVDMRLKLGLTDVGYAGNTVVIILSIGRHTIGMVVDGVSDVVTLAASELRPLPELAAFDARFLEGLGMKDGRMLIRVNVDALFSQSELAVLEKAA